MLDSQQEEKNPASNWRLLFVYHFYRLGCVLLFLGILIYDALGFHEYNWPFIALNAMYLGMALIFLYLQYLHLPGFKTQVIISGTMDIVAQALLISLLGNTRSWLGILLNATIAALSILVPGRLAIFFASIASCMLLGFSILQYIYSDSDNLSTFFYSGVHGAGIFATAITAWYLANRVRASETLAAHRSHELASMQRINEYIVERLHSGVIYVDANQTIKLINGAARQFFNAQQTENLATIDQLSLSLAKKYQEYLQKIVDNFCPAKTIINDPYLRVHFFPTQIGTKVAVLILLDDMSAVSQQAQQLKLASLGRFSASIAHELRNPLGAISHAVQLMGENDTLTEDDLRLKELIINNCHRMNRVIKNVMQLSRREQSQQQIIELDSFLSQFKQDFCSHTSCSIQIELPLAPLLPFHFDKSQLEQILVILCDNAIQHGKNKAGQAEITIKAKQTEKNTQLMVCDTGPGVKESVMDAIFDPFFSTVRTGYGMGLYIARDLCEINQAALNVMNMEKGCCFTITLNQASEMLL
ncbi:sensor histidine kinase [Legionella erythra]|uniref:histidine kinase n=1 Tax=Legionella erythra TaxID=448 RepID=A0A0W0TQJ6_LEGER|nr:HAMP domain-containing sensor histidine kinase [Legionella erythra]KTC97924.1 sensor protein PilS [Legionella erythra]